jgi:hypothetical protein
MICETGRGPEHRTDKGLIGAKLGIHKTVVVSSVVIYGFRISSFSGIGGRRDILREVGPVEVE